MKKILFLHIKKNRRKSSHYTSSNSNNYGSFPSKISLIYSIGIIMVIPSIVGWQLPLAVTSSTLLHLHLGCKTEVGLTYSQYISNLSRNFNKFVFVRVYKANRMLFNFLSEYPVVALRDINVSYKYLQFRYFVGKISKFVCLSGLSELNTTRGTVPQCHNPLATIFT